MSLLLELPHGNVDVPCLDLVHVLEQMDERTDGSESQSRASAKAKGEAQAPPGGWNSKQKAALITKSLGSENMQQLLIWWDHPPPPPPRG